MTHHCSTPTLVSAPFPTARRRKTRVQIQLECLEVRSLLSLSPLAGAKSSPEVFTNLLGKLQSQVEQGPLAVLSQTNIMIQQSDDFVSGVSAVVSSWEQQVVQQLPHRSNLVRLL